MSAAPDTFAQRLLDWFDHSGRHDLPWQHPRTPYRVWLGEIMLQQTQVKTVMPYFERFVGVFPTLPDLAKASLDEVLAQWSGLGYYARARNLHLAARRCVELHGGDLPRDYDALLALPGIGRSTAGAILAQAWGDRFAILDGNVKRVLTRFHGIAGWPNAPVVEKELWAFAQAHLPGTPLSPSRMADYTQAQMDFGATLCTRQNPACMLCVLHSDCVALNEGRVEELPTSRPGKPLPERAALILLAENPAGEILLQRRPPTGIWASLWSLPEAETHEQARAWFSTHLQGDYDHAEALAEIPHTFTHYRLRMHPLRWRTLAARDAVRDNDDLRWVAPTDLVSLGLPAPIRKLLGGLLEK
ncbi:A/G-specific adenine glycosylase [Pseudoxanthomonas sacheonensis]|uniref:Adenine DNA glycosylase n=1 Tax=Pseudoxanthomonas sacheonensis TaxID=443615 RepID=A0ABU1RMV8_9GAMM|nr:A/G-specific adenine glycosylase [Pseudoxanthomonas sacheonensis]MDR6840108.1 A/G-specific adenine glycosylase [Pseudoxanthomonas sacheonensis]